VSKPSYLAGLYTARILHFALCASVVIYNFVGYVVVSNGAKVSPDMKAIADDPLGSPIFLALTVVAASIMGALPLVRGKFLPPRQAAQSLNQPIGDHGSAAARAALAKLRSGEILSWALCESIAIFGLVLTMLSYEVWPVAAFSAVSLVNLLAYAPTLTRTEEVIRAANAG